MADYMAAEIFIGGPVRADLVPALCHAIIIERIGLEWGEADFLPETGEELLAARQDSDGALLLHLCDVEACYGHFDELEMFLQEHGIPFRRRSDAKYEYDAELIEFRPGTGPVRYLTNTSGKPFVPLADLVAVAAALDQAVGSAAGKTAAELFSQLQQAQQLAKESLPVAVPPLEPFEIV